MILVQTTHGDPGIVRVRAQGLACIPRSTSIPSITWSPSETKSSGRSMAQKKPVPVLSSDVLLSHEIATCRFDPICTTVCLKPCRKLQMPRSTSSVWTRPGCAAWLSLSDVKMSRDCAVAGPCVGGKISVMLDLSDFPPDSAPLGPGPMFMQVLHTVSGRWLRLALAKYCIAYLCDDGATASMSLNYSAGFDHDCSQDEYGGGECLAQRLKQGTC